MSNRSSSIFSLIIPTYKRRNELIKCLTCLEHYFSLESESFGFQMEVIVSDDAHDSHLSDLLTTQFSWCHYTRGPARGPAANRNHGARIASGDWLVFTDDDCLPQPGWIEAYAHAADQCDVLEGRTSAVGDRYRVDMECPVNETGGYVWSCNIAIKREIFFQLGAFNESFPAPAMEDMELYARIQEANLACRFVPTALVLHPWRLRKGLRSIQAHSRSVATFVHLHPETSVDYTLFAQCIKALRSLRSSLRDLIQLRIVDGVFRALILDLSSHYYVWLYVRQIRKRYRKLN